MQRNSGLAGSWSAFNHHDTARVVTDDFILLALNGFHDGGHVPSAGALHHVVEGGLACDIAAVSRGLSLQDLVADSSNRASGGPDMPADMDAFRVRCSGEVEGPRHRGTPIQKKRAVVFLPGIKSHAADIAAV